MSARPTSVANHPDGLPERLRVDRCLVMGVLNVTPDSFSDGGRWADTDAAVAGGLRLAAGGADIVDVGGESTRPGAARVRPAEELARVIPVVRELAAAGVCVSVDTMRAETAARAIEAGAAVLNDVSGGRADPGMLAVAAAHEGPVVLMHWRAHSAQMDRWAVYDDVASEVHAELSRQVDAAVSAGVDPGRIVIDPGLGFAKEPEHNWALLRGLPDLVATGLPVLVGASRKRFLGALLADQDGPRAVAEREDATTAITVLSAAAGAWAVRVHEPRPSADAVAVVREWPG